MFREAFAALLAAIRVVLGGFEAVAIAKARLEVKSAMLSFIVTTSCLW
jgi:hypothetical protein